MYFRNAQIHLINQNWNWNRKFILVLSIDWKKTNKCVHCWKLFASLWSVNYSICDFWGIASQRSLNPFASLLEWSVLNWIDTSLLSRVSMIIGIDCQAWKYEPFTPDSLNYAISVKSNFKLNKTMANLWFMLWVLKLK